MSSNSNSDDSRNARGITPNCPIPDRLSQQETQSECGKSVLALSQMSHDPLCPELYSSLPSSVRSRQSHYTTHTRPINDEEHPNENAKNYPTTVTPQSSRNSYNMETEKDDHLSSGVDRSGEASLKAPTEETDPDTSFVVVPTVMPKVKGRDYVHEIDGNSAFSGYCNLVIEDEITNLKLECPSTQNPREYSDDECISPTNGDGQDDLPFVMDDINEDSPDSSYNQRAGDVSSALGKFTESLSLGRSGESDESPHRPPQSACVEGASGNLPTSNKALDGSNEVCKGSRSTSTSPSQLGTSSSSGTSDTTSSSSSHVQPTASADQSQSSGNNKSATIVQTFKRSVLVYSISSVRQQTELNIGRCKIDRIKGTLKFHAQGLDQDYLNHNGTVTAEFEFPKKGMNLDNYRNCEFKLSVNVYKGVSRENSRIIGCSSSVHKLDDDDMKHAKLHMTVHNVVRLMDIIFTNVEKIVLEVRFEIYNDTYSVSQH